MLSALRILHRLCFRPSSPSVRTWVTKSTELSEFSALVEGPCRRATRAVTFASRQAALDCMASWPVAPPHGVDLLPVIGDGPGYATLAACVRAGAPPWLDMFTPTINARARAL
jgi:hypothetical protein